MRLLISIAGVFCFLLSTALAQFAPAAGQAGTTAIHRDSSVFVNWASECTVTLGYQDISNPSLGYASAGDAQMATGKSGQSGTVSLGDGGTAVLTFPGPIINGPGWDFAVFENSFDGTFLELAFVEVSSDGQSFFRFPATSLTDTITQIGTFDLLDATKLNNLAGKYKLFYGTPFDLDEMANIPGLDVNNISHVKIIDVVGSLDDLYATRDAQNNKINDPFSTSFASGGFDLDAIGVINQGPASNVRETKYSLFNINSFPIPAKDNLNIKYELKEPGQVKIRIINTSGKEVIMIEDVYKVNGAYTVSTNISALENGLYFLDFTDGKNSEKRKIVIFK
ncbi:MAG: T9SS type A sorting domain-containing protein [Bacteroidota bacterium]|nr:T9SS type A sorting domain-containing protein [Bacteroidota bacterium]